MSGWSFNDEQIKLAYKRYLAAGPNWVPDCVKFGYVSGQCDCGRVKEYKGPKCGVGCLDEDTDVIMFDGSVTPIYKLNPGDRLMFGGIVKTVVRFHIDSIISMCEASTGVLVTEWHPMRTFNDPNWFFPCTKYKPHYIYVNTVVDLVLHGSHHIIPVRDYNNQTLEFVSMAHGHTEPKILDHPYWGTDALISDLKNHPDYSTGYVNIHNCELLVNEDNVVYKMEFD